MADWIVLTALDGALLNSAVVGAPDTDSVQPSAVDDERLRAAIAQLKEQTVPVIVFTERDRTELEPVRQSLGFVDPFIVESGSAIFTPVSHNPFAPALGEKEDDYFVMALGCPYVQARAGLRVIANVVSHPLKGFGDFTVPQLQKMAKLSEAASHQAKAREFSELFMTPKAVEADALRQAAEEMGFEVILREPEESRFSELLGAGTSLIAAVKTLLAAYQAQSAPGQNLKIMAISNRSSDLSALTEVSDDLGIADWQSVLVETATEDWLGAIASVLPTKS